MTTTTSTGRPAPWPQEPIAERRPVPASAVWFAPQAAADFLAAAFPRRAGRSRFVFGRLGCLIVLAYLVFALVAVWLVAVYVIAAIWAAQLVALAGWALYAGGWYAVTGVRRLAVR
jgi:hypothetical protein